MIKQSAFLLYVKINTFLSLSCVDIMIKHGLGLGIA